MIKDANSGFDISGTRSSKWVKLKYQGLFTNQEMVDTLDLIPIGAYNGKGKRTNSFGSYLMAIYNPISGTF